MSAGSLKLDDVQLISEEISWLVKSRLPLEKHLADAGKGHGKRLERLTQSISDGLNRGESLDQLIRQEQKSVPRMLASAVAAGVRSGDLASAVEMMGDLASDLVELRRQIIAAISYPLIVLICAWLLFVIVLQQALMQIWNSMLDLQLQVHPVLAWLLQFNEQYIWWPWVLPALGLGLAVLWVMSGRANAMAFRGPEKVLLLLPGVGGLLRDLRFSTLTRMLSLLIDNHLPLPDALRAAGACCGNAALDRACSSTAETMESGQPVTAASGNRWRSGQLPPLLQACLATADGHGERFSMRLRAVADHYRGRIELNAMWLRMLMPVGLFVVIAGGTVVLYSITVFWPMREIYDHLGIGQALLP
jgi:type II secretory pathway component PulF